MLKKIRKIPVHPASKILALVSFVLSSLFLIPIGIFGFIYGEGDTGFFFGIPIFYLVFTYLLTALYCWIYNFLAPHVGGIELEFEESKSPVNSGDRTD